MVIVMIGDGMGSIHIRAASIQKYGEPGHLRMEQMPLHAQVTTESLSGVTDSAAAATTMFSGIRTYNGYVGMDADGMPVQDALELAHANKLSAGIVVTSSLTDATPAAFSAHTTSRKREFEIARQQAEIETPEVMLGGGRTFFQTYKERLRARGFTIVYSMSDFERLPAPTNAVALLADNQLVGTERPTLAQMTKDALTQMSARDRGFLLLVEGSQIDEASHANDTDWMLRELLDFDDAVGVAQVWATSNPGAQIIVTADHECGGLEMRSSLDSIRWTTSKHTGALVQFFASGIGQQLPTTIDHRWTHELIRSELTQASFVAPDEVGSDEQRKPQPN